jgi:hypothetical protein
MVTQHDVAASVFLQRYGQRALTRNRELARLFVTKNTGPYDALAYVARLRSAWTHCGDEGGIEESPVVSLKFANVGETAVACACAPGRGPVFVATRLGVHFLRRAATGHSIVYGGVLSWADIYDEEASSPVSVRLFEVIGSKLHVATVHARFNPTTRQRMALTRFALFSWNEAGVLLKNKPIKIGIETAAAASSPELTVLIGSSISGGESVDLGNVHIAAAATTTTTTSPSAREPRELSFGAAILQRSVEPAGQTVSGFLVRFLPDVACSALAMEVHVDDSSLGATCVVNLRADGTQHGQLVFFRVTSDATGKHVMKLAGALVNTGVWHRLEVSARDVLLFGTRGMSAVPPRPPRALVARMSEDGTVSPPKPMADVAFPFDQMLTTDPQLTGSRDAGWCVATERTDNNNNRMLDVRSLNDFTCLVWVRHTGVHDFNVERMQTRTTFSASRSRNALTYSTDAHRGLPQEHVGRSALCFDGESIVSVEQNGTVKQWLPMPWPRSRPR